MNRDWLFVDKIYHFTTTFLIISFLSMRMKWAYHENRWAASSVSMPPGGLEGLYEEGALSSFLEQSIKILGIQETP